MAIVYTEPKYGIINDKTSRLYSGCKVQILKYVESTKQYIVKSVESESDVTYTIPECGLEIL